MRHLITGGAGFIGSHLADELVARGDSVVVLDDLSTGRVENLELAIPTGRCTLVEGSAGDADLVGELIEGVDHCFHLASAVGVELIVDHPYESLMRNVRGCDAVLHAAAEHDVRCLFTSTSEIYGKQSTGALREDADRLLGPIQLSRWSYAAAKAFGESLAFSLHEQHGAELTVARVFNTTGPRQTGAYGMVMPRFVRQALASEPLTVFGDGRQSRCFAHVRDTVRALLLLIDSDDALGRPFNVGAVEETTIADLAARVIALAESESEIEFIPYDEAYGEGFEELGRRQPDTSAIGELVGWSAELDVDQAITDVITFEQLKVDERRAVASVNGNGNGTANGRAVGFGEPSTVA